MARILAPRSGSGRQIEMWMQTVSREFTQINMGMARAYLGTNQTGNASGGTPVKVLLDTENYDIGSNFASYKYTCPAPGFYNVNFNVHLIPSAGTLSLGCSLLCKNGSPVVYGALFIGGAFTELACPGVTDGYCTAGEYFELFGVGITSGSDPYTFGAGSSFMSVHLISLEQ